MNNISIVLPKGLLRTNAQERRDIIRNANLTEENRARALRANDKGKAMEAGRRAEIGNQTITEIHADGSMSDVMWSEIHHIVAQGKNVSIKYNKITGIRRAGGEFIYKINK